LEPVPPVASLPTEQTVTQESSWKEVATKKDKKDKKKKNLKPPPGSENKKPAPKTQARTPSYMSPTAASQRSAAGVSTPGQVTQAPSSGQPRSNQPHPIPSPRPRPAPAPSPAPGPSRGGANTRRGQQSNQPPTDEHGRPIRGGKKKKDFRWA
jgi:hypothetical protein